MDQNEEEVPGLEMQNKVQIPFPGKTTRSLGQVSNSQDYQSIEEHRDYSSKDLQMSRMIEEIQSLGPIDFYAILPDDDYHMYRISDLSQASELDWKTCKVASEDLRVTQKLGNCRECYIERPLAIHMPCGHGGSCLRCAITKKGKEKLCLHCSEVIEFILEIGESVKEIEVDHPEREFSIFPVLKIIRMVRSSLRIERPPSLGHLLDKGETLGPSKDTRKLIEKSKSGDIRRYSQSVTSPKSPREEAQSLDGSSDSRGTKIDFDSASRTKEEREKPQSLAVISTGITGEDTKRRSSQNSGSSLENVSMQMGSLFKKPTQYRGSINARTSKPMDQVNFEINERESEDSISNRSDQKASSALLQPVFPQDSESDVSSPESLSPQPNRQRVSLIIAHDEEFKDSPGLESLP